MNIFLTPRFRRSYLRLAAKSEQVKSIVNERMMMFEKNPQNPSLKNHALRGRLKGYRAFSLGYDLRAIYRKDGSTYVFFDIGTHSDVYR